MAAVDPRRNRTYKTMNRPLTVLGAERRLFFVALISGGAVFSLMHSLLGGIVLFIVGVNRLRELSSASPRPRQVLRRFMMWNPPNTSASRNIAHAERARALLSR